MSDPELTEKLSEIRSGIHEARLMIADLDHRMNAASPQRKKRKWYNW